VSSTAQSAARRFFVERVLEQAAREKVPLSKAEVHDLSWSESDATSAPDLMLAAAREDEITDDEFEAKIARLIKAAYDRDVARDRKLKARYRDARAALAAGDHYISIMIDRALGWRATRWWPF
jgi:hypothetical protein